MHGENSLQVEVNFILWPGIPVTSYIGQEFYRENRKQIKEAVLLFNRVLQHMFLVEERKKERENKAIGLLIDGTGSQNEQKNLIIPQDCWNSRARKIMEDRKDRLIAAFNALPEYKQVELACLVEEFAEKAQHQPSKPLPTPGDGTYETYAQYNARMRAEGSPAHHGKATDGKECLRQNHGHFLKKWNKNLDRDYMSQADLGKLDGKLLQRLRDTYTAEELNEFFPSEPMLNKQIAAMITEEERLNAGRTMNLINRSLEAA